MGSVVPSPLSSPGFLMNGAVELQHRLLYSLTEEVALAAFWAHKAMPRWDVEPWDDFVLPFPQHQSHAVKGQTSLLLWGRAASYSSLEPGSGGLWREPDGNEALIYLPSHRSERVSWSTRP